MAKSNVADICTVKPRPKGWFNALNREDQKVALDVRKEVVSKALPMSPVARNLIAALGLKVTAQAVVTWFKETSV